MQFGFFDEPGRKPIKASVKKEVFKRAKGRCERCGKKLPFSGGASCYHHTRKPSISPTSKTVQLLCRNCHAEHGHKHRTVTHDKGWITETKERKIIRKKVKTKRKPAKKKTTRKKSTKKKPTKRKTAKKKKTTRKKKTKKTARKKRTAKKKTKRRKR